MSQDHHIPPVLAKAVWRASSYSGGQGNCVEVAVNLSPLIPVRDSKRPAGPALVFSRGAWSTFVGQLR
ncbi:DUF397 domain-containing protein [Streptomyces ortus]|jgi:hypothetical protein|uniref:DUF397 domain-containing protein n=1 Tax=Streptomyces ortus TaxID=2867268 RepID=A0ABT3V495_9ACTN|nr:DUF397 domain-containing protein [Streptomyces ortus]MCX4234446.1 DUF397 domain-containing protein [Streptomyces ortus]